MLAKSADFTGADFERLRSELKTRGPVALDDKTQRVRSVFAFNVNANTERARCGSGRLKEAGAEGDPAREERGQLEDDRSRRLSTAKARAVARSRAHPGGAPGQVARDGRASPLVSASGDHGATSNGVTTPPDETATLVNGV